MSAWISLITLLTLLLMFATGIIVGRARGQYQVKAPATSGHPMFERAYRVQMNTLEQVLLFLPALWLAHSYGYGAIAAIVGAIWLLARTGYIITYLRDPAQRGLPFTVALICTATLMGLAGFGIASRLFS
ncbi:MAG: MAPEG family protein [Xanthomonadales bacterium]|nr:MAPEG family protein [Xanthomonadales bacterium]